MMESPVVRRNTPSSGATSLTELWSFRELLRSLIIRNLKVKYQRSVLGFLWTLVNPLLTAAVLITVFSIIVRIPMENYWAFLISGYFVWAFISKNLTAGTSVLDEDAGLRRSIVFPAELPIFSGAISRLFEFGIELGIVVMALVVFHHGGVPGSIVLLPVLVVLQFLLAVGLQMLIAVLSIFYYDVRQMIPIILLMLFYLSPVFYPLSFVPESFQGLYNLNPFAMLLEQFHTVLYLGQLPSLGSFALSAGSSLTFMVIGYAIFNRYKTLFAEIV